MSKKCINSNSVGFVKFSKYPDDLATNGFYLNNVDWFKNYGTSFIKDDNEGEINFKDGTHINYKDLINLFNQKNIYCQSYVCCFTTLKSDDFNSDHSLKKSTINKLMEYAENRDCVLFGSDLNRVFSTIFSRTVEFHNKYFKKPRYNNTQSFNTVNAIKMEESFSPDAWSCIYDMQDNKVINDNSSSTLISELKTNGMLETVNNVSISTCASFVDYSAETDSTLDSYDSLKSYVINNVGDKQKLEKLLRLCLCRKDKKYSLENEYRMLITEFSDTDIKFPNAIKLLYPRKENNTQNKTISPLKFTTVKKELVGNIKSTDFELANLIERHHYN